MTKQVAVLNITNWHEYEHWGQYQKLFEALKKQGITDLYLISEKILHAASVLQNIERIDWLATQGFTVHEVITPSDLYWDITQADFDAVQITWRENQELVGQASNIAKQSRALRNRLDASYELNQRVRLGSAFKDAAAAFLPMKTLPINLYKKSAISTELGRQFAQNFAREVKQFLLNFFLLRLPQWIDSIVYAEEDETFYNKFRGDIDPLKPNIFDPFITMVHISGNTVYNNKLEEHSKNEKKSPRISCYRRILDHIEAFKSNPLMRSKDKKRVAFENLIIALNRLNSSHYIVTVINQWLEEQRAQGSPTNREILSEHRNRLYGKNRPMLPTSSIRLVHELIFEHTMPNVYPEVNGYLEQIDVHIKTLERTTYNPLMSTAYGKAYAFLELKILLKTQGTDENIEELIETFLDKKASLDTRGDYTNKKLLSEHRFIPQRFFASETETSSMKFINSLKNAKHRFDTVDLAS